MKIEPAVKAETKKIAIGTGILTVLMIAVFLILRRFDWTVLFFLMALTVQHVTGSMPVLPKQETDETEDTEEEKKDQPLSDEAKQAGKRMQASFLLRMLMIGAVAAIAVTQKQIFNPWAALVPLLFPNILITVRRLIGTDQKEA